jgi:hypothetical protein
MLCEPPSRQALAGLGRSQLVLERYKAMEIEDEANDVSMAWGLKLASAMLLLVLISEAVLEILFGA